MNTHTACSTLPRQVSQRRVAHVARSVLWGLAMCVTASTTWAATPWIWLDGNGRRVFSDSAPPASIPDKMILQRPGQSAPASPAAASGAAAVPPAPSAAAPATKPATGALPKDDALEKKKKEAEAAELAKRAAEEKKQKEAMAENCQRAQQAKTNLETAPRLGMTNAQGQTVRMDDTTRQAELARVNRIIESSCR